MSNTEHPRYKVTAPDAVFINGALRKHGAEVEHNGWPVRGTEPVNDVARRIERYLHRFRHDPHLPQTPWNAKHQTIFLPAMLPRIGDDLRVTGAFDKPGSELPSPVPEAEATPDAQSPHLPSGGSAPPRKSSSRGPRPRPCASASAGP